MAKEVLSTRINVASIKQLNEIEQIEISNKFLTGLKPKSKAELLELAIESLYLEYTNQDKGLPYSNHIQKLFEQQTYILNKKFSEILESIDLKTEKNIEYIKLLMKLINVNDDIENLNKLINEISNVDKVIDEKVNR